jgi:hypothetical protein
MNRSAALLLILASLNASLAQYIPPEPPGDPARSSTGYWENVGQVIDTDGQAVPSVKYVSHGSVPRVYAHDKSKISFVLHYVDSTGMDTLFRLDMASIGSGSHTVDPVAYEQKDLYHNYYLPHCDAGLTEVPG